MAVAVEFTVHGNGATLQNYLRVIEIMGARPEGSHPNPDCLFHWIAELDDGGYKVTDVWTNREAFEKFVETQIKPVSEQVGIPAGEANFIDVGNYLTAHG